MLKKKKKKKKAKPNDVRFKTIEYNKKYINGKIYVYIKKNHTLISGVLRLL